MSALTMRPAHKRASAESWFYILVLLTVASYPLDGYRIAGTELSLYRILLLLSVNLAVLRAVLRGKVRGSDWTLLTLLWVLFSFVASYALQPTSGVWATSKLRAYVAGGLLALTVSQNRRAVNAVACGMEVALWTVLPFAILTATTFITKGEILTELPVLPGFERSTGGWLAERHNFAGFPRLSAPFASPPHVGYLGALAGTVAAGAIVLGKRRRRFHLATLAGAVVVTFWSFSRSALITLSLGVFLVTCMASRNSRRGYGTAAVGSGRVMLALALCLSLAFAVPFTRSIILDAVTRVAVADMGRHIETRTTAVQVALSSLKDLVIGQGFGHYAEATGGGVHSHSSYTTLLVEMGIGGLAPFLGLLVIGSLRLWRQAYRTPSRENVIGTVLFTLVVVGMILYEMLALQYVWAVLGLGLGAWQSPKTQAGDAEL